VSSNSKSTITDTRAKLGRRVFYHLQIAKVPLCLLVAFSAFFGYLLTPEPGYLPGFLVFISVLLQACGAASLNSVQERYVDTFLGRTRERPLVKGLLTVREGILQARILISFGLGLLLIFFPLPAVLAGSVAVIMYNYIYTPLKHTTTWALIPGAVSGALPPYIGWLSGNGLPFSPIILTIISLFAVWQIPHFWLVVLANLDDYRSSHSPSLIKLIPECRLKLISVVWICALVTIIHVLAVLVLQLSPGFTVVISLSCLLLLGLYAGILLGKKQPAYRLLFISLNGFMFLLMLLISVAVIKG